MLGCWAGGSLYNCVMIRLVIESFCSASWEGRGGGADGHWLSQGNGPQVPQCHTPRNTPPLTFRQQVLNTIRSHFITETRHMPTFYRNKQRNILHKEGMGVGFEHHQDKDDRRNSGLRFTELTRARLTLAQDPPAGFSPLCA